MIIFLICIAWKLISSNFYSRLFRFGGLGCIWCKGYYPEGVRFSWEAWVNTMTVPTRSDWFSDVVQVESFDRIFRQRQCILRIDISCTRFILILRATRYTTISSVISDLGPYQSDLTQTHDSQYASSHPGSYIAHGMPTWADADQHLLKIFVSLGIAFASSVHYSDNGVIES